MIRTRFAPSPTGYLHIGSVRTALFNWLFARHHKGQFILRIEDTDRARSTNEATQAIIEGMEWIGLDWDEGPFFQSKRTERYHEVLKQLQNSDWAYRCYCTAEELDAKRKAAMKAGQPPRYDRTCRDLSNHPGAPFVWRFKMPESGQCTVQDLVKGNICFQYEQLDDLVIARSDGSPTYNFCVVVDDHDMQLTHIIRGDDHLNNTPKQVAMYQALEWNIPHFAHVPMILGTDKTKLSKRHGALSVTAYRDMGYLPHALLNYLVRLGWSHGDQEIFSSVEMINAFALDSLGKSPSVFNPEKLLWLNHHYMRHDATEIITQHLVPRFEAKGVPSPDNPELLEQVIHAQRERSQTLDELIDYSRYFFEDTVHYNTKSVTKFLNDDAKSYLKELLEQLEVHQSFDKESIKQAFDSILSKHDLKMPKLAQPLRVALTGDTNSPGIFDTMHILGRDRCIQRIQKALT